MPTAEWFAMTKVFTDYGIECWLKQFMDSPAVYREFQAHLKTRPVDRSRPVETMVDQGREFNSWLAKNHLDKRRYLIFIASKEGHKGDQTLFYIHQYYRKWYESDRKGYTANRDEEL